MQALSILIKMKFLKERGNRACQLNQMLLPCLEERFLALRSEDFTAVMVVRVIPLFMIIVVRPLETKSGGSFSTEQVDVSSKFPKQRAELWRISTRQSLQMERKTKLN
jgi:hypothetical protein